MHRRENVFQWSCEKSKIKKLKLHYKQNRMPTMEIFAGGNIEDFEETMQNITSMLSGGRSKKMLSMRMLAEFFLKKSSTNW